METYDITNAANDFAKSKHGEQVIKNAAKYGATIADFTAGAVWADEVTKAEICALKNALKAILDGFVVLNSLV